MNKPLITAFCVITLSLSARAQMLPIPKIGLWLHRTSIVKNTQTPSDVPKNQPKIITSNVIQITVVNCPETVMSAPNGVNLVRR